MSEFSYVYMLTGKGINFSALLGSKKSFAALEDKEVEVLKQAAIWHANKPIRTAGLEFTPQDLENVLGRDGWAPVLESLTDKTYLKKVWKYRQPQ